ncbi:MULTISPECIES: BMP family ABC transporter substrate-binding protein [Streptomyces]|uniref:BMP family ABC transporter substrate-binding protein n=1 Tax=Streptomyces venezuelae TaxID=54571 RepID=A0A5P2BIS2_STRVZ|nr:BMP family ABC transporter substrate-binding protein [Streptomyces venezuelae]MYY84475.1 BMP family ABC transporter substrate-binding protein [Streptomyces sp. SID335]MYZ15367.1 BMP family ABC transporter substrate-binding protein [Streptomyces sp. SID337]NDZ86332.1 BMP family ABC transporter substrate-binding protein [Streptomyces sp. SID10115]NEA03769.1 BMP family ABC transporter substrate-binding protein [Streptomyces sp. SID10116]NEB50311.1 BMP family ABC transporter substrate-binding p
MRRLSSTSRNSRTSRTSRATTHLTAAVAVLALAAAGCGKTSNEASQEDGGKENGPAGSSYKGKGIGLAYDIGGQGDQSFNDAAYAGYKKARDEFKIGGVDMEPGDGESSADKIQRLEQLARQGYDPVIGVGFVYAPAVEAAAKKFPKTTFGIIDDNTVKADNVADLVFHEEQGSYLAGVAAAKASKAEHVGFVGGVDIPLIHKFEAGFVQGVKSVDPKIKIEKRYLTEKPEEGGFSSPDKGQNAASGQIESGADVIYHAAGLSGQGVIQEAGSQKKWAIGVDSDQYKQKALAKYKDYILGSAFKDVGGAVYDLTKSVVEGRPMTGEQRYDLKSGRVGFSDSNPKYTAMKDVVAAVEKAEKDIVSGKVKVKIVP